MDFKYLFLLGEMDSTYKTQLIKAFGQIIDEEAIKWWDYLIIEPPMLGAYANSKIMSFPYIFGGSDSLALNSILSSTRVSRGLDSPLSTQVCLKVFTSK